MAATEQPTAQQRHSVASGHVCGQTKQIIFGSLLPVCKQGKAKQKKKIRYPETLKKQTQKQQQWQRQRQWQLLQLQFAAATGQQQTLSQFDYFLDPSLSLIGKVLLRLQAAFRTGRPLVFSLVVLHYALLYYMYV